MLNNRQRTDREIKQKITVSVSYTKEISRCYMDCPYFYLDGGPGPVMFCSRPEINKLCEDTNDPYAGLIISHPDCDNGFPEKCPLISGIK